jgi:hypothetical protein
VRSRNLIALPVARSGAEGTDWDIDVQVATEPK